MIKRLLAITLTLAITISWIGMSYAQPSPPTQVLRIATTIVLPAKRGQVSVIIDEINKLYASAKGIQWSKIGYDSYTGELVTVTLWKSQGAVAEFMKSEARNAVVEKLRPMMEGDPIIKTYLVYDSKK